MINAKAKLQLYKSGFIGIGSDLSAQTSTQTSLLTVNNMMYHLTTHKDPTEGLAVSKTVTKLANDLLQVYTGLNNFDKRHAFLEEILHVMPHDNFAQFCLVQADSPAFSNLHRDFLQDTVNYVRYGKRSLSIHNWEAMFRHQKVQEQAKRAQFGKDTMTQFKEGYGNFHFSQFYADWMSRPQGMMDLVKTFALFYAE